MRKRKKNNILRKLKDFMIFILMIPAVILFILIILFYQLFKLDTVILNGDFEDWRMHE